jgi:hypothetical protein
VVQSTERVLVFEAGSTMQPVYSPEVATQQEPLLDFCSSSTVILSCDQVTRVGMSVSRK